MICEAQAGFIPGRRIADIIILAHELVRAYTRKGDPMSLFLFAIAMEYLSRLLAGLSEDETFKFHPRCSRLKLTHISFADDLLLFARGDLNSISALNQCFAQFSMASGLQANLDKSSLYFGGVNAAEQNILLQNSL